jgi:pimeloyl-ACP methyl ester carboxylesterase
MIARETLVMLPGMMCDARLFGPQIAALQEDHDIIVPDLSAPASIEGMARKVLKEVAATHINLLGLSMGGIVAMAMVGLASQRITRLALLDTTHLADAPENTVIRNRQIEAVRRGRLREVIIGEMKPRYLAHANRERQDLLDLLVVMAMDRGLDAFIAQSIALRDRTAAPATLKTFRGPTLLLCGEEDALCPPARHEELAAILPKATLTLLPRTGHISTLESPKATTRALVTWLSHPMTACG